MTAEFDTVRFAAPLRKPFSGYGRVGLEDAMTVFLNREHAAECDCGAVRWEQCRERVDASSGGPPG